MNAQTNVVNTIETDFINNLDSALNGMIKHGQTVQDSCRVMIDATIRESLTHDTIKYLKALDDDKAAIIRSTCDAITKDAPESWTFTVANLFHVKKFTRNKSTGFTELNKAFKELKDTLKTKSTHTKQEQQVMLDQLVDLAKGMMKAQ